MSDFLAWLSPMVIPDSIRRRWSWTESGRIGFRRHDFTGMGRAAGNGAELLFVGQGHGERGNRSFVAPDILAPRLLSDIRSQGATGLDRHLGPLSGVYIEDQGRRVLIWRDRFGRHPVQMIQLHQGWAVTTSPELAADLVRRPPRWSNISAFIHGAPSVSDGDVTTDLFRIRPAEIVDFCDQEITRRRLWWNPQKHRIKQPLENMTTLLHELGDLYGQRPHVLALSAGIDSATLAAVATTRHPGSEVITFTDPGSPRDEGPRAAEVAEHLGLRWNPFRITEHWPLSRLEDHRFPICWGPPAHPDFAWKVPCHRWLQGRRPKLPVMYGNGADEVLWFPQQLWLKSRFQHRDWPALYEAFKHLSWSRWMRPGVSAAIDELHLRPLRPLLPKWPESAPPWQLPSTWIDASPTVASPPQTPSTNRFFQSRLWRLQTWRWERVMRSMAFEARRSDRPIWTPFLDAEFWELSLSLSPTHLVEGGRQKAILRHATAGLLPERCRRRPKVGGFDPLVERGLAEAAPRRIYALFARPRIRNWSAFDGDAFLRAYEAYRQPSAPWSASSYRGSWPIWKTVATEMWLRRHSGNSQPVL